MGGVCGNVDSPGKCCLDFPASCPAARPLEAFPAIFQGQDAPRIVLNERRDLLFISGVYWWPRSALLPGVFPILGIGHRGSLPLDLSASITGCPASLELRHRYPDCVQRDIRGKRGLYNVRATRPRANGPTNQRREEYRPTQDRDL